jgi:hypothetical protein
VVSPTPPKIPEKICMSARNAQKPALSWERVSGGRILGGQISDQSQTNP